MTNRELRNALKTWNGKDWSIVREAFERAVKPNGERRWTDEELDAMTMDDLKRELKEGAESIRAGLCENFSIDITGEMN